MEADVHKQQPGWLVLESMVIQKLLQSEMDPDSPPGSGLCWGRNSSGCHLIGEPLLRAGQRPEPGIGCRLFLMSRNRRMTSVWEVSILGLRPMLSRNKHATGAWLSHHFSLGLSYLPV